MHLQRPLHCCLIYTCILGVSFILTGFFSFFLLLQTQSHNCTNLSAYFTLCYEQHVVEFWEVLTPLQPTIAQNNLLCEDYRMYIMMNCNIYVPLSYCAGDVVWSQGLHSSDRGWCRSIKVPPVHRPTQSQIGLRWQSWLERIKCPSLSDRTWTHPIAQIRMWKHTSYRYAGTHL